MATILGPSCLLGYGLSMDLGRVRCMMPNPPPYHPSRASRGGAGGVECRGVVERT